MSSSLQGKNIFLVLGFRFFVSVAINGVDLGLFSPLHLGLFSPPKPLDGSISLKFSLETRL